MKIRLARALGARRIFCALIAGAIGIASTGASAATYQQLYRRGSAHPMTFGPDGSLYGFMELYGSGTGGGKVFKLTPPVLPSTKWTFQTLHAFMDPLLGGNPTGRPYFGANGVLYGATYIGGAHYQFCCNQGGTVFSLTPPLPGAVKWRHRVLTSFGANAEDGYYPRGGVIGNAAGELFGTTSVGVPGPTGTTWGMVFRLTPPAAPAIRWRRTMLHDFGKTFYSDSDGSAGPEAGMIMGDDGTLYGTAAGGGHESPDGIFGGQDGSVFALKPPLPGAIRWRYQRLGSLSFVPDGSYLVAGVVRGRGGALYGAADVGGDTTCGGGQGCGTIFRLAVGTWPQPVLHTFTGQPNDGARPRGDLVAGLGGKLYGTTMEGGSANKGTVFMLAPPPAGQSEWVMTILHSFTGGTDGQTPRAGLVAGTDGWLYGLTTIGGDLTSSGTIFRIKP